MTTPQMACPSGGSFYACASGSHFIGCCQSNPCTNGCPAGNIVSTSFDKDQYGLIPDEDCSTTSASFYTCTGTTVPFWGCCKSNPCTTAVGCPSNDLVGAVLFDDPALAQPYLAAYNSSYTSVSIASASSTSTMSTSTSRVVPASAITSAAQVPTASPGSHQSIAGPVVGGVVGGLAIIAGLIFGLFFLKRRKSRVLPSCGNDLGEESRSAPPMAFGTHESKGRNVFLAAVHGSPQQTHPSQLPSYSTIGHESVGHVSYELPADIRYHEMVGDQMYYPNRLGCAESGSPPSVRRLASGDAII